jgi:hypothetical protein
MQMLESVALPGLVMEKSDPCWYCEEDTPESSDIKNKEKENPSSPTGPRRGPENSRTNCASKLGVALAGPGNEPLPTWKIKHKVDSEDPIDAGAETNIVPAAHHLLPGNASVNKAASLHPFMWWAGKNTLNLWGEIGYDINCHQNGVWLPGNYAVRKKTEFKKTWSKFKDPFKDAYSKAAMLAAGNLQLHDAHPAYNGKVLQTLSDVGDKLQKQVKKKPDKCPVCEKALKKENQKVRPPYGLVNRLHRLSKEHRKALDHPLDNRKAINSDYYTSSSVVGVYGGSG